MKPAKEKENVALKRLIMQAVQQELKPHFEALCQRIADEVYFRYLARQGKEEETDG